jgi:hypothetical protein
MCKSLLIEFALFYEQPFKSCTDRPACLSLTFFNQNNSTMSIMKLLSRIVRPDNVYRDKNSPETDDAAAGLSDYTYGITNDPLTQFAALMSAVIHDVDHRGIGNFDLCKEDEALAAAFENKSVAEQNSIDVAWDAVSCCCCCSSMCLVVAFDCSKGCISLLIFSVGFLQLMDPNFTDLRDCIYTDATELRRFRQLLVNSVLGKTTPILSR